MLSKWEPFWDTSHPLSGTKYHINSDNANICISSLYLWSESSTWIKWYCLLGISTSLPTKHLKCKMSPMILFPFTNPHLLLPLSSPSWLHPLCLFFSCSISSLTANLLALPSKYIQNLTIPSPNPLCVLYYHFNSCSIILHQDCCHNLPTSLVPYSLFLTEPQGWSIGNECHIMFFFS